jgi:hypothetical protein
MSGPENLEQGEKFETVIRTVHNRENPYVMVNRNVLEDPDLSFKAKGLWAYCMAKPTDWKFSVSAMVAASKEGRTAIDSAIKELIDHGYAVQFSAYGRKDNGGQLKGTVSEYIFFEFKATEEEIALEEEKFKNFFRHSGFRNVGDRDVGDQLLLNNKRTTNEEENNNSLPQNSEPVKNSEVEREPEEKPSAALFFLKFNKETKNLPASERDKLWAYFESQRTRILNPYGWLKAALKDKYWESLPETPEKRALSNAEIGKKVFNKLTEKVVELGYKYLDFRHPDKYLLFEDPDFMKRLEEILKKMGLSLKEVINPSEDLKEGHLNAYCSI